MAFLTHHSNSNYTGIAYKKRQKYANTCVFHRFYLTFISMAKTIVWITLEFKILDL